MTVLDWRVLMMADDPNADMGLQAAAFRLHCMAQEVYCYVCGAEIGNPCHFTMGSDRAMRTLPHHGRIYNYSLLRYRQEEKL
jgi:hypothetical protein